MSQAAKKQHYWETPTHKLMSWPRRSQKIEDPGSGHRPQTNNVTKRPQVVNSCVNWDSPRNRDSGPASQATDKHLYWEIPKRKLTSWLGQSDKIGTPGSCFRLSANNCCKIAQIISSRVNWDGPTQFRTPGWFSNQKQTTLVRDPEP